IPTATIPGRSATTDTDIQEREHTFKRARLTKEAEILTIRKFMIPFDILMMTPEEFESEDSLLSDYARKGEIVYCHANPKRVQSYPKRVRMVERWAR
ncbi:MAG: hypothetical protein QME74_11020, partial [Candidatus Edwardsbacteria bacterium]|nr:hypothetical protein [Candidatus Edwardsbacteria bacterium]